jgi:hypothetical protein
MSDIIFRLIEIEQQMRILHWQTRSYARHQAFGDLYNSLGDLIDQFAEVFMGKYGRFDVDHDHQIKLVNLTDITGDGFFEDNIRFLIGLSSRFDEQNDTDLLNIRDEILASLNKLKYLLTLK